MQLTMLDPTKVLLSTVPRQGWRFSALPGKVHILKELRDASGHVVACLEHLLDASDVDALAKVVDVARGCLPAADAGSAES